MTALPIIVTTEGRVNWVGYVTRF